MPRNDGTTRRGRANNKFARRRWKRRKERVNEAKRPRPQAPRPRENPPLMLKGSISAETEVKADDSEEQVKETNAWT